jgi:hypothetical protein
VQADDFTEEQRAHRLDASAATIRALRQMKEAVPGKTWEEVLSWQQEGIFDSIRALPLEVVQRVIHPHTMEDLAGT